MTLATHAVATPLLADRHDSLDVLRGIAILGILPVNLPAFALPFSAYTNPAVLGELQGSDVWAWLITHVLFDMKFITLFAFLFGAGIALFREHAIAAGDAPGRRHLRRMLGMLALGLLHAYLLWFGDILVSYSIMGLLLYLFVRSKLSAGALFGWGLGLLLLNFLMIGGVAGTFEHWPAEDIAGARNDWQPATAVLENEIAIYRGDWLGQISLRITQALSLQGPILMFFGARLLGCMLLGVAAYRNGWLLGRSSLRTYVIGAALGLGMGLPLAAFGAQAHLAHNFSMEHSMLIGMLPQYIASLLQTFGYASVVLALFAAHRAGFLVRIFAPVGRMAFSNYLAQTVLCTLFFYGHGLGQFGHWSRTGLWVIALTIWTLQLLWSPLWLRHFRFGPAEAIWRGLTYGRWSLYAEKK